MARRTGKRKRQGKDRVRENAKLRAEGYAWSDERKAFVHPDGRVVHREEQRDGQA